ncbi:MAG: ATP-binding protein [Coriobacteriia bacterium]|nr:ATP-binding protein [Coriobacteriia bacterium]
MVVLTGPRQVGKSTLLRREPPFCDWHQVTLDDFDALAAAREDPHALWEGHDAIVLDEVQKAPGVLSAVKAAVDRDSSRRFVLTGSANLLLMQHVSESLAGRASYLELGPLTLGEWEGRPAPTLLERLLDGDAPTVDHDMRQPADLYALAYRGMMPRFLTLPERSVPAWWDGYVATYLERDVRAIAQVSSLPDYRRVMEALALRQGAVLNRSELARDVGVTQPTTYRYIDLMKTTGAVRLLAAFSGNRTTRLVKSPKPYLFDSGLTSFLAGHYTLESLRGSREAGVVFEGLVLQHLAALCQLMTPPPRLYYWRTVVGAEVDVVVERGRACLGIEIRVSSRVGFGDTAGLRAFLRDTPNAVAGVVVYGGTETQQLGEKLFAVPWTALAG